MRAWFAIMLLACSWLFGLGYFNPVNWVAWFCAIAVALVLLGDTRVRFPRSAERGITLLFLLPALWMVPLPYKAMPVLLFVGVAASWLPIRLAGTLHFARGAVLTSLVLLPQSLALWIYQSVTARSHELPAWLAQIMRGLLGMTGAQVAVDSAAFVVRNADTTVRIGATWELLFDPATLCMLIGGWALWCYQSSRNDARDGMHETSKSSTATGRLAIVWERLGRWSHRIAGTAPSSAKGFAWRMLCVFLGWAVVRLVVMVAMVLNQQLRADSEGFNNVGELLVSTWVQVAACAVLALLLSWLVPWRRPERIRSTSSARRAVSSRSPLSQIVWPAAALMAALGLATWLHYACPIGQRKAGRVKVVERHSTWEPTQEPYRTKVYGEAGSYNYAAIYEYCEQFYTMGRILPDQQVTAAALADCDVLIIKTPTSRYTEEEVAAVVDFVRDGGSLLMIGDHTNVFNMNTYLNDMSRHFGFTFRNDLLFRVGSPYRQAYQPPRFAHPVMQFVPPMSFAVSCSIDPGWSMGRAVIRNVGLYNLPPAYEESNYHPQAEYRPFMQYGAWCQLWATTCGQGRVLAFADSTLFSNFCIYQPGKSELFMGMLEWLNHSSRWDAVGLQWCLLVGLCLACGAACAVAVWGARAGRGRWLLLLACGWMAWACTAQGVQGLQRRAMPVPDKTHSMQYVVIDRTLSNVPLFTGAFADAAEGVGYGMLEQWIPRIGNYISRRAGFAAFEGDGLVVICPTNLPSPEYRERLIEWVRAGGRLVVLDTPDVENSTANSLLMLFGLTSVHNAPTQKDTPLRLVTGDTQTPLQATCEIVGGEPLAKWGEVVTAARVPFGQGTVTAIGFGSLFNDASMGYHWLQEPDETQLQRYEILYALLRAGLQIPNK